MAINEEHLSDVVFALGVTFAYKERVFCLSVIEDEERTFSLTPAPEGQDFSALSTLHLRDTLTGVLEPSEISAAKIHWDGDFPEDGVAEAMDVIVGYMVERGILRFETVN